jgi:CTP synthase
MQVLELRHPGSPGDSTAGPVVTHPFFIGAQFHPELTSRPLKPQPLFMGLVAAAVQRKYGSAIDPRDPFGTELSRWMVGTGKQPQHV